MSVGLSCGHLVVGVCRRCELESEVAKLGKALTLETRLSLGLQRQLDEERDEVVKLRVEVERLRGEKYHYRHLANLIFQAEEGEELRHVAEKQREATLRFLFFRLKGALGAGKHQQVLNEVVDAARAAPLVTEDKP